jgi:hypothetical protein
MRRICGVAWLVAGAVLVFGLAPVAAQARRGYFTIEPQHLVELQVRGSHGYRGRVIDIGKRAIYLIVHKGPASVTYQARGRRTSRDGIEVRFRGVGRVSIEFRQRGRARRSPPAEDCEGRGNITRHGAFIGTIRLHGERGFTDVDSDRAAGEVVDSFEEVCRNGGGEGGQRSDLQTAILDASTARGRGLTSFLAAKLTSSSIPDFNLTHYSASIFQRRGPMTVTRSVSKAAQPDSFELGEPAERPTTATISPPAPFTGAATFQLTGKSAATWTGDLAVEFPGLAGPVSLAGPKFSSELCSDSRCAGSKDGGTSFLAFSQR